MPDEPDTRPSKRTISRRTLLRNGLPGVVLVSGYVVLSRTLGRMPASAAATTRHGPLALAGGSLDPTTIPKYVTALPLLPVMPRTGTFDSGAGDYYSIAARQFTQQILPSGLPATTMWGYGAIGSPGTFHAPAYSIEATAGRPVRVSWANQLVDAGNNFRPHLFTVDPTLHWANPPGGDSGRDTRPSYTSTPPPYTGPVPIVTHLHGAHSFEEMDGYPEAWYLPVARDLPAGYAQVGSYHDRFQEEALDRYGTAWPAGAAVYTYPNDQRATMLWFHDHSLGLTRLNVHAGLSGLYLLRGGPADLPAGVLPGPAPRSGDAPGTRYYELPLVLQDKSFNSDGSLFFPAGRGFFGDAPASGPWLPATDVSPYWNPESFGNVIMVNGRSWPAQAVEPRRYRLRLLNSCNARTFILKIVTDPLATRPAVPALPIWQIGSDGGFLPAPQQRGQLLLAGAERMDVIVDFTGLTPGTELYLINEGPDQAFDGGIPAVDFQPSDPQTTGQVLKFVVTRLSSPDTTVPPAALTLPALTPLGGTSYTWKVSLTELDSAYYSGAPTMSMLGTVNADGTANPLGWGDPVTETPSAGATQLWEFSNFTPDAHPIHIHQIQFQVVGRQAFGGAVRPPDAGESGFKDTVIAYPQEFTRFKARFDLPGRYVVHCHILDHEDNEFMRPFQVG